MVGINTKQRKQDISKNLRKAIVAIQQSGKDYNAIQSHLVGKIIPKLEKKLQQETSKK